MADNRLDEALSPVTDMTDKSGDTDKPVKTLYLSWALIDHIKRLAAEWNSSESAVAKWLLARGLESVAKGEKPEMETVTRAKLD